jgi:hypothetical protein
MQKRCMYYTETIKRLARFSLELIGTEQKSSNHLKLQATQVAPPPPFSHPRLVKSPIAFAKSTISLLLALRAASAIATALITISSYSAVVKCDFSKVSKSPFIRAKGLPFFASKSAPAVERSFFQYHPSPLEDLAEVGVKPHLLLECRRGFLWEMVVCLPLSVISMEEVVMVWNLIWPAWMPVLVFVTVRMGLVERKDGTLWAAMREMA